MLVCALAVCRRMRERCGRLYDHNRLLTISAAAVAYINKCLHTPHEPTGGSCGSHAITPGSG